MPKLGTINVERLNTPMSKLRKATAVLGSYGAVVGEAAGHDILRVPELVTKTLRARLRHDIGPHDFFLNDMPNRPRATWGDYLREEPHNYRLLRHLHPRRLEGVARDKVLASEQMTAAGLPIVPILAVVGREADRPCAGAFPMLDTVEAIVGRLAGWPDSLFVKPASGSFGRGAMRLVRHGEAWHDGEARISPRDVAARLLAYDDPTGVLVQPRVTNDERMAFLSCGDGLCATRIITALTVDGPEIVAAIHKILGSNAIADNFAGGATGNLVCIVDVESGRLRETYGRRTGDRILLSRYSHHPATGQRLQGCRLPHWQATRELAKKAAEAFPDLPLLGHDIVITGEGPLFLETNTYWRASLPQLALGGLRPILRRLIPRLATPDERKQAALAAMG
jgi:Sugar-transfer associated ATP-grasp